MTCKILPEWIPFTERERALEQVYKLGMILLRL